MLNNKETIWPLTTATSATTWRLYFSLLKHAIGVRMGLCVCCAVLLTQQFHFKLEMWFYSWNNFLQDWRKQKLTWKKRELTPLVECCTSFKGHSTICGNQYNWLFILFIGLTDVRLCQWIVLWLKDSSRRHLSICHLLFNAEKCKESDFETRLFDPLNKRCYEKRLGNH